MIDFLEGWMPLILNYLFDLVAIFILILTNKGKRIPLYIGRIRVGYIVVRKTSELAKMTLVRSDNEAQLYEFTSKHTNDIVSTHITLLKEE